MLCVPTARLLVLNVATPEFNIPDPRAAVPSMNVTLPEGASMSPGTVEVTVAVSVTSSPGVEGFAEEPGVAVELAACPTT